MNEVEAVQYAIDKMLLVPESDEKKRDSEAVVALIELRHKLVREHELTGRQGAC